MTGTIPAARQHIIDDISREARRVKRGRLPVPLPGFVKAYYWSVDEDDLRDSDPATLAAAAAGHLEFGARRHPGTPLVRVFNPTPEKDGWHSPHTVVEIVTDDMPFLVDSLAMVLNQSGMTVQMMIHPVLRVTRDGRGRVQNVSSRGATGPALESWQQFKVTQHTDAERLEELRERILRVLDDVRLSVEDWPAMRNRALEVSRELLEGVPGVPQAESTEASAFLEWLAENHFTFLGYREYKLERGRHRDRLVALPRSGLGLLRTGAKRPKAVPTTLSEEVRRKAREPVPVVITKANSVSTVHRATYLDYVGVKTFDAKGEVSGERRFVGLFTSTTYSISPREIPLLRRKVQKVFDHFGISPVSHDGKALIHTLETYPRDELFQASIAEIVRTTRGIVNLYERRRVRLFPRRDPYGRYFTCLVFVPRDRYNTQARERIEQILLEELSGTELESQVQISESALARLQILVRTNPDRKVHANVDHIEQRVTAALRTWTDGLQEALGQRLPDEQAAAIAAGFGPAFPVAYQEYVQPEAAIADIVELMALPSEAPALGLELRSCAAPDGTLHLRLYRRGEPIAMSDILPMLENFGLRVLNERPYHIALEGEPETWIQDLEVEHEQGLSLELAAVAPRFEDAFFATWSGRAESDGFNRLVLSSGLDWRQALVLRAVCRYLLQTGLPFSQRYMETVLAKHPGIASMLFALFDTRFDPDLKASSRNARLKKNKAALNDALQSVTSPDDDRILRAFRAVIKATLRTNYYQRDEAGNPKPYLSLKLEPRSIPDLPKPRPMFEIWVYSPRVEGVHLRMGKVARGGLRWSDRREDFRTEILGLMKAQNVKNTLIVPVGAKGGFVPKQLPAGGAREDVQREGVECYKTFIRALLDVTDNVRGTEVVPPPRVQRYDEDDPYLVVAADKGTATFSDTANALAADYDFWLGDAFASGGSAGYDHKKMGITAKGGWECVKRHFRELGKDIQSEEFTVAGIGDMMGDVFGNGMLLSPHIRLLAAFNHQHIFIDPDPDAARSFRERQRLFALPRSTWEDYDGRTLSKGGAVLPRAAKELTLSAQARALLGLESNKATPNEVIRAILKLPVDLLWNGGIGTYVKASWESNGAVGDRANDAVRVDARELRCKVIGEGGNLGLSQLGRIEFSLLGGRVNTDFLDNSGGVDCSDHEVNIKILLDVAQRQRGLTRPARNRLLADMTDEVGDLVLRDNYLQSQAISMLQTGSAKRFGEHAHFIRQLELAGILDRALEYLPSAEDIEERQRMGEGLTRPELCMVLSYSKIALNAQLIQSDVPEDPYLGQELGRYFPERLTKRYGELLPQHRLRREIIATATTNSIVNRMGPTFVARTQQDTGADAASVARAYTIAREAFEARELWASIEALDNRIPAEVQYSMMLDSIAELRQVSYWLIERHRSELSIEKQVARLRPGIRELTRSVDQWLSGLERQTFEARAKELEQAGVPASLARQVAATTPLQSAPDIVELSQVRRMPVIAAAEAYFAVGEAFGLDWLRQHIEALDITGHWQAVARGSLREAMSETHRRLAQRILEETRERDPRRAVEQWRKRHPVEAAHAQGVISDIRSQPSDADFASLSVALQTARRLALIES